MKSPPKVLCSMIFYFNRFRQLRQCRILLTRVSRTGKIYLLCSHRRTVRTQPEGQAMLFDFLKKKRQEKADDQQHWRERWQSLVPEENRSVPVTVDGQTRIAYIQINQFVVMLQDGLLMKAHFFDVCEFFQKAGYHVIWLMRCVQDVEGGYLKLVRMEDGGARCRWKWRKPTTNFGRWTSDNYNVSILIQHRQVPPEITDLKTCKTRVLQRVTWAESDDNTQMIPGRTEFLTVGKPATPEELLHWLTGTTLANL